MNEDPNRAHESRRHSVESSNDRLYRRVVIAAKTVFWLALAFILIQQLWASWWPDLARARVLSRLQNERKSRVIAMIQVLAAEQIAKALVEHKGKVTVFVPHYAMSGGTLIALAADQIVMDSNAVLCPIDPAGGDMPAASIIKVLTLKKPSQMSDEMLILADVAAKAQLQVASFITEVLLKRLPKEKAIELATILSDGHWTHDFPITVAGARQLGLPVS